MYKRQDYKKAVADQKNGVCDRVIHAHLAEYRKRGITWLREGGDIYGTSKRTMELAPAYGITYRTPIFAIHKKGHYGAIVGRGYETMQEYRELIGDLRRQGGHFVKIMISGIMDFTHGGLTEPSLADSEIRELIHIAHEEGFPVMAHTNGSQAVRAAALAGVAGVLYAHNLSMLKVSGFDYNMSILILVYVVLGGIGNLRGSMIATIILYALPELLRGFANYRMLIYAIVLIVMMLFNWAPAARNWRARVVEKFKGTAKKKEAA